MKSFSIRLPPASLAPATVRNPPSLRCNNADAICARVERALAFVDAARIGLNPDCGFAPSSAVRVDLDEVYQKLCREVVAAERLRAKVTG